MHYIDFRELRKAVPLARVLAVLGYEGLRGQGAQRYGPCPLGCNMHVRCASFNLDEGLWHCHACRRGGNQLDLYMFCEQVPLYYAAIQLCKVSGVPVPFHNDTGAALRLPKPPV